MISETADRCCTVDVAEIIEDFEAQFTYRFPIEAVNKANKKRTKKVVHRDSNLINLTISKTPPPILMSPVCAIIRSLHCKNLTILMHLHSIASRRIFNSFSLIPKITENLTSFI